jgi:predicted dehydrogenase
VRLVGAVRHLDPAELLEVSTSYSAMSFMPPPTSSSLPRSRYGRDRSHRAPPLAFAVRRPRRARCWHLIGHQRQRPAFRLEARNDQIGGTVLHWCSHQVNSRMPVRLIQIGVGGWGRNWVEEITRATPGIQPVAWVDADPAVRARAVVDLGLPEERMFAALEEALARVSADAALVVVPLAAHAAVTRDALEAGLHVLVEKPFTETLQQARELAELAKARQRVLMVNQNYRWFPAPALARRLLHEGAIGDLIACYLDFHLYFGTGYRYFFLDEPLLSDMAIHHFDSLRFVLDDEPVEVSCHSWAGPGTPFAGHPAAVATMRFAKGTVVSYRGSWLTHGPGTPYGGHWRLDGSRGTATFTFRGAFAEREKLDRLTLYRPDTPPENAKLPAMRYQDRKGALITFARWIREGSPPEGMSTATDNLKSLALMFAAIRSARMGGATVRMADLLEEAR